MVRRTSHACVKSKSSSSQFAVFDLPRELLVSIALKDPSLLQPTQESIAELTPVAEDIAKEDSQTAKSSSSCLLCNISFANVQEQRQHSKSDWHKFNLKQKVRGRKAVGETEFEKLLDELEESISGSGSDSNTSDSDADDDAVSETTLNALLKKQAKLSNGTAEKEEGEESMTARKIRGAGKPPLMWFSTPLLPSNTSLGIYRALFTNTEQEAQSLVDVLRKKQLRPVEAKPPAHGSNGVLFPYTMTSPSIFMCMIGGGHFAGMIVSLAPKTSKHSEQRQAFVIAHKTFHRYTTRRKQGGGQSANDAAKGAAHSAGSSLRRYNEVALEQEVRALLADWKGLIDGCQLIFVRSTGSSNRRIIFGPYEGNVLRHNDPRNRTFPFSTRRATQAELMRSFVELTRVKVSHVDEEALAASAVARAAKAQVEADKEKNATRSKTNATASKLSKEEEAAALHTSQIQALIRRSKAPALLQYLTNNAMTADFCFHPPTTQANHHAPRPIHLASSINSAVVVLALLTKAGASPAIPNADGKVPFELAGERATRDAFRVARSELGEARWDWASAKVPPALSKTEAEKRDAREKAEAEKAEKVRRLIEEERLKREGPVVEEGTNGRRTLGLKEVTAPKTAEEKREEEGRGMTPEMRTRLERERRARAAEARMKR